MILTDFVSYLEMTSPDQLRPAVVDRALRLRSVGMDELPLVRKVHDVVAGPHDWESLRWSEQRWREHLGRPGVHTWIAEFGGAPAGLAQLQVQPGGDVETEFFGLMPEFIGRGIGGGLLTLVTRAAWGLPSVDGTPIQRVWQRTSVYDHPNALPGYLARGYRLYRTEARQREFTSLPR
ncbi:GNAT family N-acetyltransferase [Micromonospora sp. KC723]|uniref:GNAT family N-acetyltransferase n=1 Tax=Micromonospora sp. KC723 TaxID=2530381 RepID=UPI0014044A21|nr:GNAT family N-acetyltransferase [Micromonospora sp. KC723]